MIGSFNFNNINSESFGLVCKSVKRPLLPAVKVKRIELPGTSGAYDFDSEEYSMRQVTMKIQYIGTNYEELRSRARSIAAWLGYNSWAALIINDEDDKYYISKITSDVELDSLYESGSADVTFDCQPFACSVNEEVEEFSVTEYTQHTFTNPGTRQINYKSPLGSRSLISITGTFSTISVSMNDKTITYGEAGSGALVFDNVEMEVSLGGINKFNIVSGDIDSFFTILPGENTITISGTGMNVSVVVRYIPLWM